MPETSRRAFLTRIGHGALLGAVGCDLATELVGALPARRGTPRSNGKSAALPADFEGLVAAMQETAPDALMAKLVAELRGGTSLATLVGAGAIANARAFGGEDYDGYHVQMALLPAQQMAALMPAKLAALPVLKVLHRNARRIQATGGARNRLDRLAPIATGGIATAAGTILDFTRKGDGKAAEYGVSALCRHEDPGAAFDACQPLIRDDHNVHRVVLAWRSWDMLPMVGGFSAEHPHTMLRQFVRFCADQEQQRLGKGQAESGIRKAVPRLLDQHRLLAKGLGARQPDDAFVDELATAVFGKDRDAAADAVAAALAEGFDPDAVAEAIALAGNKLLLHDTGKKRVHGASVGVHATDAANAWRHLARLGPPANRIANLLAAAWHTGGQSAQVGEEPYDFQAQLEALRTATPAPTPLAALERAIEGGDQRAACAAASLYAERQSPPEPIFDQLLRYAVSEDGALHAEKYFHTAREEFRSTRPALRWRHVVALARVTASQHGEPAPGVDVARGLLEA